MVAAAAGPPGRRLRDRRLVPGPVVHVVPPRGERVHPLLGAPADPGPQVPQVRPRGRGRVADQERRDQPPHRIQPRRAGRQFLERRRRQHRRRLQNRHPRSARVQVVSWTVTGPIIAAGTDTPGEAYRELCQ